MKLMTEDMRQRRGQVHKEILEKQGWSIAYDGDMVEGRPQGYGKAYYKDGRFYEGEWLKGRPHGQGKLYYDNMNIWYEGEWVKGKREGFGKSYYEDGSLAYEGQWKDGKPEK